MEDHLAANGHIPILTGGTGFYIQAVLYDIDFTENGEDHVLPGKPGDIWRRKRERTTLHEMLMKSGPRLGERRSMPTISNG